MASPALDALDALDTIKQTQSSLRDQYGGKASAQFVEEVKGSALFLVNWGELLAAAPTAISMMSACYIAASNDAAERIVLTDTVPTGGFRFLTPRAEPTLRTCLIDVCNNGGREAFSLASDNMETLRQFSFDIANTNIPQVLGRLAEAPKSVDHLEDFTRALDDFSEKSTACSEKAAEIQLAFQKWGMMVGEFHVAADHKSSKTAIRADEVATEQQEASIEQSFAIKASDTTKKQLAKMSEALDKAEKRLDTAMDKIPSGWATVAQSALTSFAQAIPAIAAAAIPAVMTSVNPAGAAVHNVMGSLNASQMPQKSSNLPTVNDAAAKPIEPLSNDAASAAAYQTAHLFTTFFAFLGGETGDVDWSKFGSPSSKSSEAAKVKSSEVAEIKSPETAEIKEQPKGQGIVWLLGQLKGEQSGLPTNGSVASQRLSDAFAKAIAAANEIKAHQGKSNSMNAEKPLPDVIKKWKADVRDAKNVVLALSAASASTASINMPISFPVAAVPKPDLSMQTAQLSGAMQGVQMAQTAVESAQANYDLAIERQEKAEKVMLEVEKKLMKLKESANLLESVKQVLADCIKVLVALIVQIGKLEKFFNLLSGLIKNIILEKTKVFAKEMAVVGNRASRNGYISLSQSTSQIIYSVTLQSKAYFSMLHDIAHMYVEIDRKHISKGVEMCIEFSGALANRTQQDALQNKLRKYNEESGRTLRDMVNMKKAEILSGLKERAKAASSSLQVLEETLQKKGLPVDASAKQAIQNGGQEAQKSADDVLKSQPGQLVEYYDFTA